MLPFLSLLIKVITIIILIVVFFLRDGFVHKAFSIGDHNFMIIEISIFLFNLHLLLLQQSHDALFRSSFWFTCYTFPKTWTHEWASPRASTPFILKHNVLTLSSYRLLDFILELDHHGYILGWYSWHKRMFLLEVGRQFVEHKLVNFVDLFHVFYCAQGHWLIVGRRDDRPSLWWLLCTDTMFSHGANRSLVVTLALLTLTFHNTLFIKWVVFENHKAVGVYEEWWQLGLRQIVIYGVRAFAVLRSASLFARASRTSLDEQRVR